MCDRNTNNILNVNFESQFDSPNWLNEVGTFVVSGVDGLEITSNSATATFSRQIGSVDASNNRIKLKCNFNVEKSQTGPSSMEVIFRLVSGSNILYESSVGFDDLTDDTSVLYLLERDFIYTEPITSQIKLVILIPDGWENKLILSDLEVTDFNFCQDNVRTYFVLDEIIEDGLVAISGGIELLEWKVDGLETLTQEFFNDTNIVGGSPIAEWKFAKADLDGENRVAEILTPITFNPFLNEFKLNFDEVNSYYGGKPIGTLSGADYGNGILEIGVDKPIILNGNLQEKKGAFFIDINYDLSLKVIFNVIINLRNSNLFTNPTYLRKYTIDWNTTKCEKRFYYEENGVIVPQDINGFLSGLTPKRVNDSIDAFPLMTRTRNTTTGVGGITEQTYNIYGVIQAGFIYKLSAYGGVLSQVIADTTDTFQTVVNKLRDIINNKSISDWQQNGGAPNTGTNGFPPVATSNGSSITILLNHSNEFLGSTTIQ